MTFLTNEQRSMFADQISEQYAEMILQLDAYIKYKQKEWDESAKWDEIVEQLKKNRISFSNKKPQSNEDKIIDILERHPDYTYTSEESI